MRDQATKTRAIEKVLYEEPRLIPIGNLHDVVAGSTQLLPCDSQAGSPGGDTPLNPHGACGPID